MLVLRIRVKKIHLISILIAAFVLIAGLSLLVLQEKKIENDSFSETVNGPIHWHPKLTIYVDGQEQTIFSGIGITIGKVMDTRVSGMMMSPMHTHDVDGVIHMEQMMPTERTMKLGYFFEVWGETFNQSCIFKYCNDDGKTVKMFVNGQPNYEFENYMPKDGDDIVIKYE